MAIATGQFTIVDLNDPVISGTAPPNPVVDMLWLDNSITPAQLKRWTGSAWVLVATAPAPGSVPKVFLVQPEPPYYVNDIWQVVAFPMVATDIKKCTTQRLTGSYTAGDWVNAYTTEQIAAMGTTLIVGGYLKASLIQTGSLLATVIKGGDLTLGGITYGNGRISIKNDADAEVGYIDKTGIWTSTDAKVGMRLILPMYSPASSVEWLDLIKGKSGLLFTNDLTPGSIAGASVTVADLQTLMGYPYPAPILALQSKFGINIQANYPAGASASIDMRPSTMHGTSSAYAALKLQVNAGGEVVVQYQHPLNTFGDSFYINADSNRTAGYPAYYGAMTLKGNGYDWGRIYTTQPDPSAAWTNWLAFQTMNGPGGGLIDRMAIDNAGNVVIGANATRNHQLKIQTGVWHEPTIFFESYSNYVFSIGCYGTSGSKKFQLRTNDSGVVFETGGNDSKNVWMAANCSALSFTDRTPFYEGDALSEIKRIKGKNGEIDHSTLPKFVQVKQERIIEAEVKEDKVKKIKAKPAVIEVHDERDLGAMISMLTVAVQQIAEEIDIIKKK